MGRLPPAVATDRERIGASDRSPVNAGYTQLTLVVTRQDDHAVVRVGGDLDHDSSPELHRELEQAIDDDLLNLNLDLAGVTFIDSAALQIFVSITDALAQRGGTLTITDASPVVARILEVTRLGELLGR
jgi:anti-anti-sigma factor